MSLTKSEFVKAVASIQGYEDWKVNLNNLGIELSDECSELERVFIGTLHSQLHIDNDYTSILNWFFWENNFGRAEKEFSMQNRNIKIKDAEALWDIITDINFK